ncbi:MAG: glycoside hydrolase family 3 C-terminal domain-containing protein [Caulobacteraceae bacterium]|nr:glycoside hydrolase family 3 C-terminal domain-containing protein [Caulobacteraceae bacterium]
MASDATTAAREIYQDPSQPIEARVADLVGRMTLEEKVLLMAGAEPFALPAIERLGIPSLRLSDGPTGVRSNTGEAATVFPVGVAMAATWNPELAKEVAAAIAREAKALGEQVILAPTINIVRTPVWGRNFETYSEDPFLAGQIAVGYVDGLQGEGIGASLKHYAANNQELNRMDTSAELDERTLREIYLAAFETVVKASNPWTVMASYNRLWGTFASENTYLLSDILKGEWGYDGVVVSDWGAVHSTAPAANAGLDLEMPGPPRWFGDKLLAAVKAGEVAQAQIDEAARRLVRLMLRCGVLDAKLRPEGELRSQRHRAIARAAAEEAIVLLKNEGGLLPLDPGAISSLAAVGPNAAALRFQGGGSSRVRAGRRPTPLDSLRAVLGDDVAIVHAEGGDPEPFPPLANRRLFSPDETRDAQGLKGDYFASADLGGAPVDSRVERHFLLWYSTLSSEGGKRGFNSLRWSGWFWPQRDGVHEFSVRGDGPARLVLDGAALIDETTPGVDDPYDVFGYPTMRRMGSASLVAGRGYPIQIDYVWAPSRSGASSETLSLGLREPTGTIEQAVEAVRGAEAAIVFVGSASTTEAEGYDRADIDLPGEQNALVEAVLAVNPDAVIVVNAGAPMTFPWIDKAKAVLLTWLPGEEGPDAIAEILFGKAGPSGRLPVTFPKRLEDNPAQPYYTGEAEAPYGEGLFVGYRHFDRSNTAPLFPFGFGLTYGAFDYADLVAPATARTDEAVTVSLTLANTGGRTAKETVQLYVRPHDPALPRPVKELKGFSKVELAPGERRGVSLTLTPRDFAYYDPDRKAWITDPGAYDLLVGASTADIRLERTITLTKV